MSRIQYTCVSFPSPFPVSPILRIHLSKDAEVCFRDNAVFRRIEREEESGSGSVRSKVRSCVSNRLSRLACFARDEGGRRLPRKERKKSLAPAPLALEERRKSSLFARSLRSSQLSLPLDLRTHRALAFKLNFISEISLSTSSINWIIKSTSLCLYICSVWKLVMRKEMS